jgi:hypothetical protein
VDGHPLFFFGMERLPAFPAEAVILSPMTAFRLAPFGFDQILLFHPMEHGVKHALAPNGYSIFQTALNTTKKTPPSSTKQAEATTDTFGGAGGSPLPDDH